MADSQPNRARRSNPERRWRKPENLVGKKFGLLEVIEAAGHSNGGKPLWKCLCQCGEIRVVQASNLKTGHTQSCGCLFRERPNYVDLSGRRYGRLVVVEYAGRAARWQSLWKCRCDCGNTTISRASTLNAGTTQSCGCLGRQNRDAAVLKHGYARRGKNKSGEYQVWGNMIARCGNPKNDKYRDYGGRGIKVCERWLKFENFIADMGRRPSSNHEIDRINNAGNYEPGNCRWVTKKVNSNNKRNTVHITANGQTKPLQLWSEETGIKAATIRRRIVLGWSPERAVSP